VVPLTDNIETSVICGLILLVLLAGSTEMGSAVKVCAFNSA
jgi:hypothetical protein